MNSNLKSKNSKKLSEIYRRLHRFFGPQHWWPGETPLEVAVGAILTQNTAWTNVKKAILNLKRAKALNLPTLFKISDRRLARLIKPAGFFNLKCKRLKEFFKFLKARGCIRDLMPLRSLPTKLLREDLLAVKGIGPETADSILLYALNRPIFVVDAYTKRIFSRHQFFPKKTSYEAVQNFFEKDLSRSRPLFNEYHALLVAVGKDYCRPRPRCESCPLSYLFRGKIPKKLMLRGYAGQA
jgi:endonuclease-3 related protein